MTAVVLAACVTVLALRRPDQFQNPQLWAEDGIFYFQARVIGAKAFLMELSGYFHLAPRLTAALASLLDPAWVPQVFVGSALALTLWVVARVLSPRCALPGKPWCALAIVLAPDASEVLLNALNIQWVFAAGFVALLLTRDPTRPREVAHDTLSALLFGLTGPSSILMTPFFAWRAWVRRTRPSIALAAVVAGCGLAQGLSLLAHPQPLAPGVALDAGAMVAFPGVRIVAGSLLGAWQPAALPQAVAVLLTLALGAALAALALRRGPARGERLVLAAAFVAFLAATFYRCWHSMPVLCVPGSATRYVFPLQVLLLWLLLATVQDTNRLLRLAGPALALWIVAVNVPRLRIAPLPDLEWGRYAAKLRAGEEVEVPINPPGWTFPFPARER